MKRAKHRIRPAFLSAAAMLLAAVLLFAHISSLAADPEGQRAPEEMVTEGVTMQPDIQAPEEGSGIRTDLLIPEAEETDPQPEAGFMEPESEEAGEEAVQPEEGRTQDFASQDPEMKEPETGAPEAGEAQANEAETEETPEAADEADAAGTEAFETGEAQQEETPAQESEAQEDETGETRTEADSRPDIYAVEGFDYSALQGLNFSSRRILVGAQDKSVFVDESVIVSDYRGVYILQFDDEETTVRAYAYYLTHALFVEADTGISIAEGEAAGLVVTDTVMTEERNPLSQMEEAMYSSGFGYYDIALIDTGADGADESVSMIGDFAGDDNGHGTSMLGYIRAENPNAGVLSIKALGADGRGDVSAVYAAIEYALSKNVRIISMSVSALASADSVVIERAVNEAVARGIIVVGAAGNNGRDARYYVPGGIEAATIIGAAGDDGLRIASSNYGACVDYNVAAGSTSEAAARFSGWLSAHSMADIIQILDKEFIYSPGYEGEDSTPSASGNEAQGTEFPIMEYMVGADIYEGTATIIDGTLTYQLHYGAPVTMVTGYVDLLTVIPVDTYDYDISANTISFSIDAGLLEEIGYFFIEEAGADTGFIASFNTGDTLRVTESNKFSVTLEGITVNEAYFRLEGVDAGGFCGRYSSTRTPAGSRGVVGESTKASLRRILYYGADGPGTIGTSGMGSMNFDGITLREHLGRNPTQNEFRAFTAMAVAIAVTGTQGLPLLQGLGTRVYNYLNGMGSVPGTYKAYIVDFDSGYPSSDYQPIAFMSGPQEGYVAIRKSSQANALCEGNALYSLQGAVYEVYRDTALTDIAATLTTKADGSTDAVQLPAGTYYVIESKASPGHAADPDMTKPRYKTVTITPDHTAAGPAVVVSAEPVLSSSMIIRIAKKSEEYPYALPLEGAVFEIRYYDTMSKAAQGTAQRIWKIRTLRDGNGGYTAQLDDGWLLSGSDALYKIGGSTALPLGTYTIEEISSAPGYTLSGGYLYADADPAGRVDADGGRLTFTVSGTDPKNISLSAGNAFTGINRPVRMDTVAVSIVAGRQNHTHYLDAAESFGVIMDSVDLDDLEPGQRYRLTGRLYVRETSQAFGSPVVQEFTAGSETDETVKLLFGITDLQSLEGNTLVVGETLEAYVQNAWVKVAEEIDLQQEKQSVRVARIRTTLTDDAVGEHITREGEDVILTDTVQYCGLVPGEVYTLKGSLIDPGTGDVLAEAQQTFTAQDGKGSTQVTFTVALRQGQTLVACEELYHEQDLIASHKDPEDEAQIVHVPRIRTSLKDPADEEHDLFPDPQVILKDTVTCENLIPGLTYVMEGILMDRSSGAALTDTSGNEITARAEFTPEEADGSVELEFSFDAAALAGCSIVAFESLRYLDTELAGHKDPEDPEQTVYIPQIKTSLEDPFDGGSDALAQAEIQLTDRVAYENLIPGKEYILKGILYDKDTGQPALDDQGDHIRAESSFTAESPDGTACVTFHFSGLSLAGKDVVAFEELYTQTKRVAVHADIEDAGQTIGFPKIDTTLKDTPDPADDALAEQEIRLTDTVPYENLIPGRTYTLQGVLMDQETQAEALDDKGQQITAQIQFTPETAEGETSLTFTFSGVSLAGHTLVAYERLYRDEKLVAIHCDIGDFDQSVWIPKIRTTLLDAATQKHVLQADPAITLTDHVVYTDLIPGNTYTVKGILMDRASGAPAVDDRGSRITAQQTFTAESRNGSVDVTFAFPGSTLKGRTLVAFEDLYREEKHLAVHADLNAGEQTVYFHNPPKGGRTPRTGDPQPLLPWILLAAAAGILTVIAAAAALRRRQKR